MERDKMTGLEKMMDEIRSEAKEKAQSTLDEAKERAEARILEARQEAEEKAREIREKTAAQLKEAEEKMSSAVEREKKRALLQAKQRMIEDVISKAKADMLSLPEVEYFELLSEMIASVAHQEARGVLFLSGRDRERLPEHFMRQLRLKLPESGELELSDRAADISGGFLLDYDGVEENGSFDAIFASQKECLQDKVREILF